MVININKPVLYKSIKSCVISVLFFVLVICIILSVYEKWHVSHNRERLSLNTIFSNNHIKIGNIPKINLTILVATGDISFARSINRYSVEHIDYQWPFSKTKKYLNAANVVLANLESPIIQDCPSIQTHGDILCGNERFGDSLRSAGINIANIANNHIGDYGGKDIVNEINLLHKSSIEVSGTSITVIKKVNNTKFAFLGFNDIEFNHFDGLDSNNSQSMINWADKVNNITQKIKNAKSKADVVVVSFHWGAQYTNQPTSRQQYLAHLSIDAGADLIIGNHPHWIQPIEIYKGKIIVYSLGNFIFDQEDWPQKMNEGMIGNFVFDRNRLIDVEFLPIRINNSGQPYFLEAEEKDKFLENLKTTSVTLSLIK